LLFFAIWEKIMKCVFLDRSSVDTGDLDLSCLQQHVDEFESFDLTKPDQVDVRIKQTEIIICNKVLINEEHMKKASNLKLICVAATGYNNIDIKAANRLGVIVCNVRSYATHSVVEHLFGCLLSLSHHLNTHHNAALGEVWRNSPFFCVLDYPIRELNKQTLGIIGYGELGQGVAQRARQFGMKVIIAQSLTGVKREGRVELDKLLQLSDVVTLHCPLSEESRNLIGERELELMKDSAYLVNVARGGIVDEAALAKALHNNSIAGAVIDVLTQEPPKADNPLLAKDLKNLILTPHVAWAGHNSRQTLVNKIAENIEAFIQNKPRNVIS